MALQQHPVTSLPIAIAMEPRGNEQNRDIPCWRWLILIFLLAILIRLIGWNMMDFVYRDTVNFIVHAAGFSIDSLRDPLQEPIHPLLIAAIHRIFFPHAAEIGPLNSSSWELSAFLNGMIFTILILWLLYEIGRFVHSPAAGLAAAFFFAVQPYGIKYGINGLSEIPYLAFILLSLYLAMRLDMQKRWPVLLTGLCVGVVFFIRKEGIILLPVISLYLLGQTQIKLSRRIQLITALLTGTILTILLYLALGGKFAWLDFYFDLYWRKIRQQVASQGITTSPFILANMWLTKSIEYFVLPFDWIRLTGFIPGILFFVFLLRFRRIQINRGWSLLVLYLVFHFSMAFAIVWITKLIVARYLFPAGVVIFPLAAIPAVEILARLNHRYPGANNQFPLYCALVISIIMSVETFKSCYNGRRGEILAATRWIAAHTPPDAILLTTDDRIGFYSSRPWNTILQSYKTERVKLLRRLGPDRFYIAFRFEKHNDQYIDPWLKQLKNDQNIQAQLLQQFKARDGVYLYKLIPHAKK